MRVDFANDKNGWIVGHVGIILRSSDKDRTWVCMESSTGMNLNGLYWVKKYGWSVAASEIILEYLERIPLSVRKSEISN
ncbi:MAG: hypothetical protein WBD27_04965 [Pyrinomonadaceae bacterium]